MTSLEELFNEAQKFGRVFVYQADNGGWSAWIEFNTVDHVKLKAESSYGHKTVQSALTSATERAVLIVESMRANTPKSTQDTQEKLGISAKISKLLGVSK